MDDIHILNMKLLFAVVMIVNLPGNVAEGGRVNNNL